MTGGIERGRAGDDRLPEDPPGLELRLPDGVDAERLLEEAVEAWGAERSGPVTGGTLHLPVLAGIRRGRMLLRTRLDGGVLSLEVERETWRVHRPAAMILLGGATGALTLVFWPFFPSLLAVAPIGFFLAVGAWILVAARLRNAGPPEFLELVEELALRAAEPRESPTLE